MSEGLRNVSFPVAGMSCAACAGRVEKALSRTAGVVEANVNLAAEKASVEYDPALVGAGELVGAVEGAGYGVETRKANFGVGGMSCASCVGRVEKALRGVPGVVGVNVNLATEVATVEYLEGVAQTSDFERAVGEAGYGVVRAEEEAPEDFREREYGRLRGNFVVATVLTVFILAGSLAPMLGFEFPIPMIWLNFGLLALATPVQFWAGWRFYRGRGGL
jgi:P-type Cu+ transporter